MHYKSFALVLVAAASTAFAADTQRVEPVRTFSTDAALGQPVPFDASRLKNVLAQMEADAPPTKLSAAPPLTYLQVWYVGSSTCGWESISDSQTTTICDHGGSQLRVVVMELGYGGNPIGFMNSGLLSSSANYLNQGVCRDAYGQLVSPCSAGQTIVGWLRYWNLDGYQGGYFQHQNTSLNSPWNTMYDNISIL